MFLVQSNPASLSLLKTYTFPMEIKKTKISKLADENAKCYAVFERSYSYLRLLSSKCRN